MKVAITQREDFAKIIPQSGLHSCMLFVKTMTIEDLPQVLCRFNGIVEHFHPSRFFATMLKVQRDIYHIQGMIQHFISIVKYLIWKYVSYLRFSEKSDQSRATLDDHSEGEFLGETPVLNHRVLSHVVIDFNSLIDSLCQASH